jgi:hypothetical protein
MICLIVYFFFVETQGPTLAELELISTRVKANGLSEEG